MTDVHVTIERLILEGLDPGAGGARLGVAVAAELARLLGEGGLADEHRVGGARRSLRGGDLEPGDPAAAANPDSLATQIAGAIYGGLGQ